METTTASASGVKRKRAGPSSSTTGKKTTQMVSVAASAGTAICWAPSRMATVSFFPRCRFLWMFSTSTVASSTSMPMARARPPSVMMLSVWPERKRPATPTRMASGMDATTMTMLRTEPRKTRIISETRIELISASRSTFAMAARTNTDWSKSSLISIPSGAAALIAGIASRAASTTAMVEASDFFSTTREVDRRPSPRTMFDCTA